MINFSIPDSVLILFAVYLCLNVALKVFVLILHKRFPSTAGYIVNQPEQSPLAVLPKGLLGELHEMGLEMKRARVLRKAPEKTPQEEAVEIEREKNEKYISEVLFPLEG